MKRLFANAPKFQMILSKKPNACSIHIADLRGILEPARKKATLKSEGLNIENGSKSTFANQNVESSFWALCA
jgi:hypothetical protein